MLTGTGIDANVTNKLNDILLRSITSGGMYAGLVKDMSDFLTTTENGDGALKRYAQTWTNTSLNQFAGQNNKLMTDDLGLEWFMYVGSNKETTREFCDHLNAKKYIHKSEIPEVVKGHIDGHECEIYEKTGLPKGMIAGTNADNFQVNCGGWNCGHKLVPVAMEAVPKGVIDKFIYKQKSGIISVCLKIINYLYFNKLDYFLSYIIARFYVNLYQNPCTYVQIHITKTVVDF
ncbi:MAG: hypothetical protein ACK5KP_02500 [Paludibacteraceae bacterium]